MPQREIDRPLTLPQRQSHIKTGLTVSAWKYKNNKTIYGLGTYAGLPLPGEYSYAINDSLQVTLSPFPLIQYQFLQNTIIENGQVKILGPSMAVFAGLGSIFKSYDNNELEFSINAGINGKSPLNKHLWLIWMSRISAGNAGYISSDAILGICIQTRDILSIITEVKPRVTYLTAKQIVHTSTDLGLKFQMNLTDHFGLDVAGCGSIPQNEAYEAQGGITAHFNW